MILVLDTSSTQAGLISSLIKVTCATQLLQLQVFIIQVVVLLELEGLTSSDLRTRIDEGISTAF